MIGYVLIGAAIGIVLIVLVLVLWVNAQYRSRFTNSIKDILRKK